MNGKIIQIVQDTRGYLTSLLLLTDEGIVYRAIEDGDKYIVKEIKFHE